MSDTKMVAKQEQTKMVAPDDGEFADDGVKEEARTVTIECLVESGLRLYRGKNEKGEPIFKTLPQGKRAKVTESEAQDFCRVIEGTFNFRGELFDAKPPRHTIQRARRVEPAQKTA